jgi:NADH dehydrogenase
LATIGRKRGITQIDRFKVSGFPAWLLWSLAHIYFLIGFRNRLVVALNWAWNYLTFQRGTRLITGITGSRIEDVLAPSVARAVTKDMASHSTVTDLASRSEPERRKQRYA